MIRAKPVVVCRRHGATEAAAKRPQPPLRRRALFVGAVASPGRHGRARPKLTECRSVKADRPERSEGSPRRGPARARSDKEPPHRTGHASDVHGPGTALRGALMARGPGAALARPACPVPERSGGRPAPAAAWAGRRYGLSVTRHLEPASGPLVAHLCAPIPGRRSGAGVVALYRDAAIAGWPLRRSN